MSEEKVDISGLGSFDFTPDWARKSAGVVVGRTDSPDRRDSRPPRADGERRPPRDKFKGDRFGKGERFGKGGGKPFEKRRNDAPPRMRERVQPLEAEIKILPETKALGTIIRKLQGDTHAYKLRDLAQFFLDNPQSILLKVVPKGEMRFFQCKACSFAAVNEEDVVSHILTTHLCDYYDSKEVECEPPKGNFSCVAKCGLSGELLGPPNIHEFNSIVKEMIRKRYPDMTEERYRASIEMVRDSEEIERWRAGATHKTVFTPKGGEGELSREQAEGEFRRTILPTLVDCPKHLMITAEAAMKSPVKALQWAVRDAVEAERRAPYAMCFALRGAFHHRKLRFFRANDARGPEFVTGIEYKPFDSAHAIPELAKVADFIAANPCCDKSEFASDPETEKHLAWLVSTGHVVSFTNGVYSQVEKYPKYGPQWRKRRPAKTEPAESSSEGGGTSASEAAAPETTAPETAAPEAPMAESASPEAPAAEAVAVEVSAGNEADIENKEAKENETAPQLAE